jgi:hypothetical protein
MMHSNVLALHSRELTTEHQRLAEIIEMIQIASLIHDDVIDDSRMRRGMHNVLYEKVSCVVNRNHSFVLLFILHFFYSSKASERTLFIVLGMAADDMPTVLFWHLNILSVVT